MKVSDLKGAAYNPRKIDAAALAALKNALEVFGDLGGIVFNQKTGNIVSGHQRAKTFDPSWPINITHTGNQLSDGDRAVGTIGLGSIKTPFGEVPFRVVEWDLKTEQAGNIAANRHGGEWDDLALKGLLVGLDDGSGLVDLTGFGPVDLEGLLGREKATPTPSENEVLFEQITFTLTKAQLATVGFMLDAAVKAGPFVNTGNENARGNALARICEAYKR